MSNAVWNAPDFLKACRRMNAGIVQCGPSAVQYWVQRPDGLWALTFDHQVSVARLIVDYREHQDPPGTAVYATLREKTAWLLRNAEYRANAGSRFGGIERTGRTRVFERELALDHAIPEYGEYRFVVNYDSQTHGYGSKEIPAVRLDHPFLIQQKATAPVIRFVGDGNPVLYRSSLLESIARCKKPPTNAIAVYQKGEETILHLASVDMPGMINVFDPVPTDEPNIMYVHGKTLHRVAAASKRGEPIFVGVKHDTLLVSHSESTYNVGRLIPAMVEQRKV